MINGQRTAIGTTGSFLRGFSKVDEVVVDNSEEGFVTATRFLMDFKGGLI